MSLLPGIEKPYDTCIEFTNPLDFAATLAQVGLAKGSSGKWDVPIGSLFSNLELNFVEYGDKDFSWGEILSNNPFLKGRVFSDQMEYRIVFTPVGQPLVDSIILHHPGLLDYVKVVDLSGCESKSRVGS